MLHCGYINREKQGNSAVWYFWFVGQGNASLFGIYGFRKMKKKQKIFTADINYKDKGKYLLVGTGT